MRCGVTVLGGGAGRAARYSAGDAADHAARRWRRQLFLFNHGDVFGNRLGGHQASGVELARNDPDHFGRGGRWRRRRGRRRRSYQKAGQLALGQSIEINHRNQDRNREHDHLSQERYQHGPGLARAAPGIDECLLKHKVLLTFSHRLKPALPISRLSSNSFWPAAAWRPPPGCPLGRAPSSSGRPPNCARTARSGWLRKRRSTYR